MKAHPLLDAIVWLFRPVIAWWTFLGMIPFLTYCSFGLVALLVLIQVVRLVSGR